MQALLIIDMLKDFVEDWGSLKVEGAKNIIQKIKKEKEKIKSQGGIVIYVNDAHLKDDKEFLLFPKHCIYGTVGAEVVDELKPQDDDFVIYKRRYSGFFQTNLDLLLRENKIQEVILCGLVCEICVYHTAADAFFLGYKVKIKKDCVVGLSEEDKKNTLLRMQRLFGAEII